jgi:hypothetical protein
MGIIPTNNCVWKRWLTDLSRNIVAFGPGAGLLATQIDYLERRCVAMHLRIEGKRIKNAGKMGAMHHTTTIGVRSIKRPARLR